MKNYTDEFTGQVEFYERINLTSEVSFLLNNDGIYRGNIFENKLNIKNIYNPLFQAIKYCSKLRTKGLKIPANILLNDLNRETTYIFKSEDFLNDIEKVYSGGASLHNEGYKTSVVPAVIDYSTPAGLISLLGYINNDNFTLYHVDINNIYGLSVEFYNLFNSTRAKDAFMKGPDCEIRRPNLLKDRILPYEIENNNEFRYIMDCLNPPVLQKELGAFYTPFLYAKKAQDDLLLPIIPKDKDYIIIDRCAGTGDLYEGLPDEILSHCILSTIEPNEWVVLNYHFGDRCYICPIQDSLDNPILIGAPGEENYIIDKVNDPNIIKIIFENPPYSETFGDTTGGEEHRDIKKDSFISIDFKKKFKTTIKGFIPSKEISNLFIWSSFEYYNPSYCIFYSPVKYFKSQNIINKKFIKGFLFNRKWFHASESSISCICWGNITEERKEWPLVAFDINNGSLKEEKEIVIKRVCKTFNEFYFDKMVDDKDICDGIWCSSDGYEGEKLKSTSTKNVFNKNILGYLHLIGFVFGPQTCSLTRITLNVRKNGFYLRENNFYTKMPLFCSKLYGPENWFERDIYYTTADGEGSYVEDSEFLKKCFIYSCLTQYNKCLSFLGSDMRQYKNELCFDEGAVASEKLSSLKLTEEEEELIYFWKRILRLAKEVVEYNKDNTYGLYQIIKEINVAEECGVDKRGNKKYRIKYPDLNSAVIALKNCLKSYYKKQILPDLFKYELLK